MLGSGVSGDVFLLQHKVQKKLLALKVIRFKNEDKLKQLIETEVKVLHECHCDHIVRCYASYFNEGTINIVLEYMNKGTLADVLKKVKKIPEEILGLIAYQILKGLDYLQKAKKIVHRDIKPCNILLNSKGFVKISDFGVSGIMKNSLDSKHTLVGTYIYMSPERIEAQQYSFNSDVWSVAISLMECALGFYPYMMYNDYKQLSDIWSLSNLIKSNPVPKLPDNEFSLEFTDFIAVCLNKDLEKRPTATTLLNHPFILLYENKSFNELAKWLAEIK
jgi:mitogen-activated protein kinase kinase 1